MTAGLASPGADRLQERRSDAAPPAAQLALARPVPEMSPPRKCCCREAVAPSSVGKTKISVRVGGTFRETSLTPKWASRARGGPGGRLVNGS